MKYNKQKSNLIIDITLFAGFIFCFFLDLTGVITHQWLGVALCGLSLIHLLAHADWVTNVLKRFSDLPARPQILLLINSAIALGFFGILATGLTISTWFNLTLTNYYAWKTIHVAFSIETLVFLVVKIGYHWKWISSALRSLFESKSARALPVPQMAVGKPSTTPALQPAGRQMSRRDFLAVMGVVGVASYFAISSVLKDNMTTASAQTVADAASSTQAATATSTQGTQSTATATSATSTATATTVPTATQTTSYACSVRCNRHCSYPGQCHRYVDSNSNGFCDNGECL
jgi:hypothetical protein